MSKINPNELRHIHLDFHTPGFVSVGDKFDAKEMFDTLEKSKVNSLALFAKCHHGYSYFDTEIGTRHPGLAHDMFGMAALEAAKRNIDFLGYFSLNVDEVIADKHPEWVALNRDGSPVDSQILQDGSELYWRWLCPNRGGYLDEFFFPHVEECLAKYSIDGIFIDMAGYLPGSCYCDGCASEMRRRGLDPDNDQHHTRFNSDNMQAFAGRLRQVMDKYKPGMRLQIGCYNGWGEAHKAGAVVSEFYVESLAFQTGWFNFPVMGRYLGNASLPVMGLTGRFLKNWGDFGTVVSPHQLKMQIAAHLSIGASCGIGDHMHCNGQLDEAVYEIVEEAFTFAEMRQPYCCGMERAREVAVLVPDGVETNTAVAAKTDNTVDIWDRVYGASKLLMEGHYQWDVIGSDTSLEPFSTAILVHNTLNANYIDRLKKFVNAGGTLIVDTSAIEISSDLSPNWLEFIGLASAVRSPHPGSFYRAIDATLAEDLPKMAHYVHAPSVELTPADGTQELARAFYPPCVRSRETFYGHFHGADEAEGGPSITCVNHGKGQVIVLGQSILSAYLNTGYHAHRTLLTNLLDSTLPNKIVKTDAPSIMEITVGRKNNRTVVQFLAFVADRRHRFSFESLNEPIPIGGVDVRLRIDGPVNRVWNPIENKDIEFRTVDDGVEFEAPVVVDHLVVLVE